MKARGLASPDKGDALALTFAEPVHKASELELLSREENRVQTEYDLFA